MDRLRTLANFIRHSSTSERERRTCRFQDASELVAALAAIQTSDELVSAAMGGDEGLFQHLGGCLKRATASDPDVSGACAWRMRRLLAAPVVDIHMESSLRLRILRRAVSDLVECLESA